MSELTSPKETKSEVHITRFCPSCKYCENDIAHMIDHLRYKHSYPETIIMKTIKLQETLTAIDNKCIPIVKIISSLDTAIYTLNKIGTRLAFLTVLNIQFIQKDLSEQTKNIHKEYNEFKKESVRIINSLLILHSVHIRTLSGHICKIPLLKNAHMNMTSTEIEEIISNLEKDKLIFKVDKG